MLCAGGIVSGTLPFHVNFFCMNHNRLSLFLIAVFALCSCCGDPGMELTYEVAGENRAELESVMEHYRQQGDAQKLRAAEFLISNMAGHFTKTSAAVDSFTKRMLAADTLTTTALREWWKEYHDIDHIQYISDAKTLKAEYLIDNIESAFKAWEASQWKAAMSEDLFLNYILPYRLIDEPLSVTGWRDSLYHRYHHIIDTISDIKRAYHAVYRFVSTEVRVRHLGDMPYLIRSLDVGRIRRGRCQQQCVYIASVMRALGIPAVVDGISCWANYGTTGHSWVALVLEDGTYTVGVGDSVARRYNPINSSSFSLKYKVEPDYPVRLDFVKTAPKIWRPMYAMTVSSYEDALAEDAVRQMFSHHYSADVSAEYGLTGEYTVSVPFSVDCAYFCVFSTGDDWKPVAYAQRDMLGRCRFKDIADSVAYLPVAYKDGRLMPLAPPFFLSDDGIKHFTPDTRRTCTAVLTRKYPFAKSILRAWAETAGASVVASGSSNFAHADTLFSITRMPVFRNVAYADTARRYRYVKYASHPRRRGSITELCVYSDGARLTGEPFAAGAESVEACFDGDTFTDMTDLQPGYAVGLDLGRPLRIDSVAFYLRNDGNYITLGDDYELFYYDKGWISLGRQEAKAESLIFGNVPSGALLLLRNHSRGKEERIFTYENGMQTWW